MLTSDLLLPTYSFKVASMRISGFLLAILLACTSVDADGYTVAEIPSTITAYDGSEEEEHLGSKIDSLVSELKGTNRLLRLLLEERGVDVESIEESWEEKNAETIPSWRRDYDTAFNLMLSDKLEDAEIAFVKYLNKHNGSPLETDVHYWLGSIYNVNGKHANAIRMLSRVKRTQHKRAPEAVLILSKSKWSLRNVDGACEELHNFDYPEASIRLEEERIILLREFECTGR